MFRSRTGQTEELRLLLGGEDGVVISDPGVVDQEPGLKRPLHEDGQARSRYSSTMTLLSRSGSVLTTRRRYTGSRCGDR